VSTLLPAAWLAVRRGQLVVPLAAASLLVVATLPWADQAPAVMHGVAVLVACAFASALDDPTGDVATAAPVRRVTWTWARLAAVGAAALPVLLVATLVARLRFAPLPLAVVLAEAAGYLLAAVAVAAVLRARRTFLPSYPAVAGVLVVALVTYAMPRGWTMVGPQPWGPPYEAALWRWLGFGLVLLAVLGLAVRDPLDRAVTDGRRRRS
jgi:hypothetical protein